MSPKNSHSTCISGLLHTGQYEHIIVWCIYLSKITIMMLYTNKVWGFIPAAVHYNGCTLLSFSCKEQWNMHGTLFLCMFFLAVSVANSGLVHATLPPSVHAHITCLNIKSQNPMWVSTHYALTCSQISIYTSLWHKWMQFIMTLWYKKQWLCL